MMKVSILSLVLVMMLGCGSAVEVLCAEGSGGSSPAVDGGPSGDDAGADGGDAEPAEAGASDAAAEAGECAPLPCAGRCSTYLTNKCGIVSMCDGFCGNDSWSFCDLSTHRCACTPAAGLQGGDEAVLICALTASTPYYCGDIGADVPPGCVKAYSSPVSVDLWCCP